MKRSDGFLTERKSGILRTVVESYIENGEPVGSKYLCECGRFSCSSATIRNEMAELEELGYLEQPHTSSGRVPTEAGYRFYVDCLMESYNSTTSDVEKIKKALREKRAELDQILTQASRLASSLTNYTGVALRPGKEGGSFARYEVICLSPRSLLLVMINPDGSARTRNLRTDFDITQEETAALARTLNENIVGLSADDITLPLMMRMEEDCEPASQLVSMAIKSIYETASERATGAVRLDGMDRLLTYPEYSDTESIAGLLGLGDSKNDLLDLVEKNSDPDGEDDGEVKVLIGSENHMDALGSSALVFKTVRRGGKVVGAVGVIGPRRMKYRSVISMVDSLASGINELISDDALLPGKKETEKDEKNE
ncbi:MAG: heat-inducible transcriptional repressor HrcA [Eubacteriales bacterium]|nr:heat-inducible transcriptional repressor HrcA [Eubacteriales bacterium]